MIHTPAAVAVPLRTDENAVIRIGQTRVTLTTVIGRYNIGDNVETIHQGFPTVSLTDLYAVIAYYLANRETIDAYIQQIDDEVEQMRRQWEVRYTAEQKAKTEQFRQQIEEKRQQKDA